MSEKVQRSFFHLIDFNKNELDLINIGMEDKKSPGLISYFAGGVLDGEFMGRRLCIGKPFLLVF